MIRRRLVVLLLALSPPQACGSLQRAGTDAYVVATSPVRVFTEGARETGVSADALGLDGASRVVAAPFLFTYHALEHVLLTGLHAGDFVLSPIYGGYDLVSDKQIRPLEIYPDLGLWDQEPGVLSEGRRADELRQEYRDENVVRAEYSPVR
ncbi:MAG: hypothetical protein AAF196_11875 [Planctomycetota bacterium]